MVTNTPPEFDPVLESYLMPVTEEAKRLELSRRLVVASAAETEKERADIINFSSAFSYEAHVEAGIASFERIPPFENNRIIDNIIVETHTILKTIMPEKILGIMGGIGSELIDMIRPQIIDQISTMLGGVSG